MRRPPAAGGQFLLFYRHHPDYQGKKPTHELIERLHREHLERQAAIHSKLQEIHQGLTGTPAAADDVQGPARPLTTARRPGTTRAGRAQASAYSSQVATTAARKRANWPPKAA